MATTDALTNALIGLFTASQNDGSKNATLLNAEQQAVSGMQDVVDGILAGIPELDFPVEKQVIDAVVGMTLNILADQIDNGVFDIMAALNTAKANSATQAAQVADANDPNAANEAALESASSGSISLLGSSKK